MHFEGLVLFDLEEAGATPVIDDDFVPCTDQE
jgi:hypothetical protein